MLYFSFIYGTYFFEWSLNQLIVNKILNKHFRKIQEQSMLFRRNTQINCFLHFSRIHFPHNHPGYFFEFFSHLLQMSFNLKFKFDILLIFNMSLPPKEITSKCSFISIEGNIGSGKSTILRIIRQKFPQLMTLDEPLSEWQHVGENKNVDLLSLYYSDPNRWGFTFQLYTFMTRLKNWSQYSKITEQGVKLSQRSLLSDKYIFANIMQDMNILNPMEYQLYLQYYKGMSQMSKIVDLNGVIYIKCTPEICSERIKKRNRQGQTSIPLDYLQKIHDKHEQWLVDNPEKQLNVLILNNTQPLDQTTIVREISQWLRNFQSKQQLITSKTQSEDQQFLSFPNYITQNQQMMSL